MPLYSYQVMDKTQTTLTGKITADQEWTAVSKLRSMGYLVLEVSEVRESALNSLFGGRRKVKLSHLSFFTRQLAAMLSSGIPLTRSLYTLSREQENPLLGMIAGEVARSIEGGVSFSESLRAYPDVFSDMFVDMIRAGEVGGAMEEMLERLSTQLERDKNLQDSVRSATIYPSVILIFAVIIVTALLVVVVPIFKGFIPEGTPIPLPTKMVMFLSDTVRGYSYLYMLGLVLAWLGVYSFTRSRRGRSIWDFYKFRLPVFGVLLKKVAVARFARTFATLLAGGIPVIQALEAAGPASGSKLMADIIKETGEGIQEGKNIFVPLEKSGFFPPILTSMVAVGEETGQLAYLLGRVADFFEEEVSTMSKALASLLEPLMIIGVGLVIGLIVIAIYLPIFTTVTSMGK
ncbi:type IV fimbrial assembly protein PilC [Desulfocucumis palustris]|uniref:Type IV fimbrial assembly protein PilC n=1 Tax=Desulfocucumis palustris TaxID=1898651 RepID=A0A2L2XEU4_9FIRM|nr:type II secretion system F family protein [Desulfocucumis palustris]GBF32756.1 type IV fimbrial assembly protein PilC [Desulfocucumis palustris]